MTNNQKEVQQSELKAEERVLKRLKQIYSQASEDCANKIAELGARADLENIQSAIYQKQYQQALKSQIDSIYSSLHSDSFTTVSEYLTNCYKNGYAGTMYDLQKQSIPIITPIDQKQVVKAVQTNSKLSKSYYDALSEDVSKIKKSTWQQVARGIANGSSWNEVAQEIRNSMTSPTSTALHNAQRIARTEGHRIQNEAQLDAMQAAVEKGADIVKQWDATLDGRTRPDHKMADGQIREIDDYFIVGGEKMKAPGVGGSARNVCNCRCKLLQRARWGLDDEELKTLQKRAAYFGLDKTKDFEEYKTKYMSATVGLSVATAGLNLVFTPASSTKEAEKFAKDVCGIETVSYKGCSVEVANAMNESLVNALNYCPELKDNLKFYGSAQERNKALKSELTTYYTKHYTEYYLKLGYSPEQAAVYGEKYGKQYASRFVGRVSSDTYALAYSGKCSSSTPDELKQIRSKYSGIGVNTAMAKDYAKMQASVQSDVAAQFHPVGCDTVRSIFDHEFGHQLDYVYDLRSDKTIQQMYSGKTAGEIKEQLSKYASTNIAEYIAEAYSEYLNNPNARATAKTIGAIIEKKANGK